MKGRHEGGKVIIEWDANHEILPAPFSRRFGVKMKYLPCENCGKVVEVKLSVHVSFFRCQECRDSMNVSRLNACPDCGEQNVDSLVWKYQSDVVRCNSCSCLYEPKAQGDPVLNVLGE